MKQPPRRLQRGITLVELMVALAIGMLLTAGLALMFGNASRSNLELERAVRQIENGRYAIDLLGQEISMAGFYGTVPATKGAAVTAPCTTGSPLVSELRTMATADSVPFAVQSLIPSTAAGLSCLSDHKPGTSVLIVRRLETETTPPQPLNSGVSTLVGALATDRIYVQSSHNTADEKSSGIFKVGFGNVPSEFTYRVANPVSTPLNPPRQFLTRIYYIASCNQCPSDSIPTLKVAELQGQTFSIVPLVEGIEQIAFDIGFDTDANVGVDEWYGLNDSTTGPADANHVTTIQSKGWGNAVAVRVSLLARTLEGSATRLDTKTYTLGMRGATEATFQPPVSDRIFKRHVFTRTIRLHSWAAMREGA